MTGMRESWRRGETTRAIESPAAVLATAAIRIRAIPTHRVERFEPSNPICRRANSRGTK